jgi:hypothetical protein
VQAIAQAAWTPDVIAAHYTKFRSTDGAVSS